MASEAMLSTLKCLGAVVTICIVSACANSAAPETARDTSYLVRHIAVQPFYNMVTAYGEDSSVRSLLSGKAFVTGKTEPHADAFMTQELVRRLQRQFTQIMVTASPHPVIEPQDLAGIQNRSTLLSALQESGRSQGADVVLSGFLYDFQERIGRDYGVERPARLAFELNLIRVRDGRMLWRARFAETQQSLNANLFELGKFLKRKGRWVTAKEMAGAALEEKVSELSNVIH